MPLTKLDNLISSKTGRYLYVSPDDFNASDALDNRGNTPIRPFLTIQRAFLEVARFSYVPDAENDRFDQFTIMLSPGNHYVDNRPGDPTALTINPFGFDQANNVWTDTSILDLSNPNNVLYKFNSVNGGATIPRGTSLVGMDLRRTQVRPLYVPDPADKDVPRTSMFNVTGGCYFWQFTIMDGDAATGSPLYSNSSGSGEVYFQPNSTQTLRPEFSHHKITNFVFADKNDLSLLYRKIAKAFSQYQPTIAGSDGFGAGQFTQRAQENRIVGPLQDGIQIESITPVNSSPPGTLTVTVRTKVNHGFFQGQFVVIANNGLNDALNGSFRVNNINSIDPKEFNYILPATATGLGLVSGNTYTGSTSPKAVSPNAGVQAELDSVESASPYVFNVSIRSTWGICGIWADGSRATGFKSMVIAQYTGVSLQKDDRAFIRYDEFTNTWNQASLTDAFGTTVYHTKGDAYWKDDWRNFHVRASEDSFIQCVSIFAVGFADHFLMESGGDMSITNSNSNFGNTSLHAIGHKGFAFNQDKGGYLTHIIPPRIVSSSTEKKLQWYTVDIKLSNDQTNDTKVYLGADDLNDPGKKPATSVGGFRIGASSKERLYVQLDPDTTINESGPQLKSAEITPTGFKRWSCALDTLNPQGLNVDHLAQDAANQIDANKEFIAKETFGFITEKYPALLNLPYLQAAPGSVSKCQRDVGFVLEAWIADLRLGGNINTIQAAESYYTAVQLSQDTTDGKQDGYILDYINGEKTETLEAFAYARNLAIAAMRNWDYTRQNVTTTNGSAIVTVGNNLGIVVGMRVTSFSAVDSNNLPITPSTLIPPNTFVKQLIGTSQIELGNATRTLTVNATASATNAVLKFELQSGVWATYNTPYANYGITQDTVYPECNSIAVTINTFNEIISTIINTGIGSVARNTPVANTAVLSQRSTLFTLTEFTPAGTPASPSNPHDLETGTPVRLVPRPLNANVDKRVVRLPKGFDTNTLYYVIAPGRKTFPADYSTWPFTTDPLGNQIPIFGGSDQQKLMLATSPENASAGIYIYSPETDSVDPNVVIDLYSYVLDTKYDAHKYKVFQPVSGGPGILETTVAHNFDLPKSGTPTIQKVFFRVANDISGSELPTLSSSWQAVFNPANGKLPINREYWVRYVSNKTFTIHNEAADAIAGTNPITFQASGIIKYFYVYANKKRSPVKFDTTVGTSGNWYLQTVADPTNTTNILRRLKDPDYADITGKLRTTDSYFVRIEDTRDKDDRIYRFRYVVPSYKSTVRDPLNGFVIKIRTDDKRKLRPQKIILKPANTGVTPLANFSKTVNNDGASVTERLGLTNTQLAALPTPVTSAYDPYNDPKIVETDSKVAFTIQSAKTVITNGIPNLELTVFDHTIINVGLKNEIFTSIKVAAPQGGNGQFIIGSAVTWSGFSSGSATVHAWFPSKNFLILRNITLGNIDYNGQTATTFSQGTGVAQVTAVLAEQPNGGRDRISNNLYVNQGSNVYTITPGDTITDDVGGSYFVDSVTDDPDLLNTYYIFGIKEIKRRIPGQQDGVYYLSCVRGDIRPFPTGAGINDNFRNFKFSQPISKIYPLNYKNDPLLFQVKDDGTRDSTILDPAATSSAADNYVHGLVTVNDNKRSLTKEVILDFISDPGSGGKTFSGSESIKAIEGNATSGSEDRLIKIGGISEFPLEQRLYVELRRPSIARSGNHTFEYLGFGPGNYSTGFPSRQEVVLTDTQDFYAQAKKQDAGIVFYTGLNSNGDLYIGNRKINAITGEEKFLEAATLESSEDEAGDLSSLVTTFDQPVTFNDITTFKALFGQANTFLSPIVVNVAPTKSGTDFTDVFALTIITSLRNVAPLDDGELNRDKAGDIVIGRNIVRTGALQFNTRGGATKQQYSMRNHTSNTWPGGVYGSDQNINFGGRGVLSGDILFKGTKVTYSGSLGWIYANDFNEFTTITSGGTAAEFASIQGTDTNVIKVTWGGIKTNATLSSPVTVNSQLRITGVSNPNVNGIWTVLNLSPFTFNPNANFVYLAVNNPIAITNIFTITTEPTLQISIANSKWKEVGVVGSETIRTKTDSIGDYRMGINTIARAAHTQASNSYIDEISEDNIKPRANLDLVGTLFVSGRRPTSTQYAAQPNPVDRVGLRLTDPGIEHAVLIGGDSSTPSNWAALRIDTISELDQQGEALGVKKGRIGINVRQTGIGKYEHFVVDGNTRIGGQQGNLLVEKNVKIGGNQLDTLNTSFNLLTGDTVGTINIGSKTRTINIGNSVTNTAVTVTITAGTPATVNWTGHGLIPDTPVRFTISTGGTLLNGIVSNDTSGNPKFYYVAPLPVPPGYSEYVVSDDAAYTTWATNKTNQFYIVETPGSTTYVNASGSTTGTITASATPTHSVSIGTTHNGVSQLNIHTLATNSTVNIGTVPNVGTNISNITLGGAFANLSSSTRIRTHQTKCDGNLEIGTGYPTGSSNTVRLFTQVQTLNLFDSGGASIINFGNNAGQLKIGSEAGLTDIRNSLRVGGSATVNGNINLNGGLNASTINIVRGRFSIPATTHSAGDVSYRNIDLLKTIVVNKTIDTQGNAYWGGSSFAVPGSTIGEFFLYLKEASTATDFGIGDFLLIDRSITPTPAPTGYTYLPNQANSEIVKITELTNLNNVNDPLGFRIKVQRAQLNTTQKIDHPDNGVIVKLQKFDDASWITNAGGITAAATSVTVSDFTGAVTTNDYLILSDGEIVAVSGFVDTDIQSLIINDGGTPAVIKAKIESTTGNTTILGSLAVGDGANSTPTALTGKVTISALTGNTIIDGTLNVNNSIILNGTTTGLPAAAAQVFKITDGASTPLTKFQIDSANGNTIINGGDLKIFGSDGTTNKLQLINSSGDLTVAGVIKSTATSGTSVFESDLRLNGGDFQITRGTPWVGGASAVLGDIINAGGITYKVTQAGTFAATVPPSHVSGAQLNGTVQLTVFNHFRVNNTGSIDMGGINNYFTPSGGRTWVYAATDVVTAQSNVNYFIGPTANMLIKLPASPATGDMIRFLDIRGGLTFNLSVIVRAPTSIRVQGDDTNTGTAVMGASFASQLTGYNGGELIVQTPHAGLGLIFAGSVNVDGTPSGIPDASLGWWLVEV